MEEMRQSVHIIKQCLDGIPKGHIKVDDNKISPPSRTKIKQSMDAKIWHVQHFRPIEVSTYELDDT